VLARFFARSRAEFGDCVKRTTLIDVRLADENTARNRVRRWQKYIDRDMKRFPDKPPYPLYVKELAQAETRLAAVLETNKTAAKDYVVGKCGENRYYTMLPDGELSSVHYDATDNIIVRRGMVDGNWAWIPLTDPEMPLWFHSGPDTIIKL
jgi:hypothetical protein